MGSIPVSGRPPGGGHGNPFYHFTLSMALTWVFLVLYIIYI